MKMSDKLRLKMQTAVDRQKALMQAAEDAGRELTAEETAEFDGCTKSFDEAKSNLARVEEMEARDVATKAATAAATKAATTDATGLINRATVKTGTEGGVPLMFGQRELTGLERAGVTVWAAAKAHHYPAKTPHQHLEDEGFTRIAEECKAAGEFIKNKSWLTTGGTTGQNVITTPLSAEFIEWLGNQSAFMRGNPQQIDLSYGALDISGGNGRTQGSYTAEGADIPYTEATTRKISLAAKHLRALTAIGNHAIEVSPMAVASLVGDELASSMVLAMDSAGLRGDGTGNNPAGILSLTNAAHKFAAANTATPTLAQVDADAQKMLKLLTKSNIPKRRRVWMMAANAKYYLSYMRDGNGNFAYPGLQADSPTWLEGYPVIVSEQIPSTLGAGTNESEIYLTDFGHVLMGITRALTLKASTEASYKNSGGTLVSAFSLDETVIRATASHDFDLRYDKASVILQACKWGSA